MAEPGSDKAISSLGRKGIGLTVLWDRSELHGLRL